MKAQQRKSKLSEFISPNRNTVKKAPLCDKQDNQDPNAIMESELQRRLNNSSSRSQKARKLITEKVHQVHINEINSENVIKPITHAQVERLEFQYRDSLMKDSHDESRDMPLQLKEIPHPMPMKPQDQGPMTLDELQKKAEDGESTTIEVETKQTTNRKHFLQRVKQEKGEDKKVQKNQDFPLQSRHQRVVSQINVGSQDMYQTMTSPIPILKTPKNNATHQQNTQRGERSQGRELNVNADEIKRILQGTQSKVKQNIKAKNQSLTRNLTTQSLRQTSQTRKTDNSKNFITPRKLEPEKPALDPELQSPKDAAMHILDTLNARVLQRFFCRKAPAISDTDYEIGYLFCLIVSIVEESIVMNNGDLKQKSWDSIQKQLSNYGKIIYSLQKLKYMLDNAEFMAKAFRKMSFLKKFQSLKAMESQAHESAQPVLDFVQGISGYVDVLLSKYALPQPKTSYNSRQQSPATFKSTASTSRQLSSRNTPIKNLKTPSRNKSRQHQSLQNSAVSKRQTETSVKVSNMINQKRETVNKTYELEVRQSLEIHKMEEEARQNQIEIARLEFERKKMLAIIEKEDLREKQLQEKAAEQEYLKYQSEMRARLGSPNKVEEQLQKQQFVAQSKEEQKFRSEVKQQQREKEMQSVLQESQRTLNEKVWKEQQAEQKKCEEMIALQSKATQLINEKEKQLQEQLQTRETETDDRLKETLEQANYKYKKLEEQRQTIRKELEKLSALRQKKK